MSKPRDPVLAVLKYFENADVALARQALALAQAIVTRRAPRTAATKPKAKPKPTHAEDSTIVAN